MRNDIQERRLQAQAYRVASRLGLTDPRFNIREIAKQLVLLEDHLSHAYKACPDCIRKHLLTIEALAEEATALGAEQQFTYGTEGVAELTRRWMERIIDGESLVAVGQDVRNLRKVLAPVACDPRERATTRVANRYQLSCPHRGFQLK